MAEVNISDNKKKAGKPDMTPLVDLGFLLITFFIYTTTFNKPAIMGFATPKKEGPNATSPVEFKNSITLILTGDDRVFYYQKPLQDVTEKDLIETSYGHTGVRKVIMEMKANAPKEENWTLIIKPTDKSNWKNTVDILDEAVITGSNRKALLDLTDREKEIIQKIDIY
ncbi:ExbD/TolR family protein [Jiulongibacter sp. NS-SX5]|uniref:ExbD/TolR family protein n=1 Tax=Jiulongibacter sp. NS-SX5 TaxID=3463854 RepID=UPI0040584700